MTEQLKTCCVPAAEQNTVPTGSAQVPKTSTTRPLIDSEFVSLDGGWFKMGADDGPHPRDGEGPVRSVFVDPFAISKTAVTYREFAAFVAETGYVSVAEQASNSFVFFSHLVSPDMYEAPQHAPWWRLVEGACWRLPFGPDSPHPIGDDHPVVHIAHEDARAFCYWSGHRLPTEAEWECAARGGLVGKPFPWGNSIDSEDEPRLNVWRGRFPEENRRIDGHVSTVPVKAYAPNAFGVFNMTGNVWERVADRFSDLHSPRDQKNPLGPLSGRTNVGKGGSYLCHDSYCFRYRTSSRQELAPDTTAGNIGFRLARRKKPKP